MTMPDHDSGSASSRRILVVEDVAVIRFIYEQVLGEMQREPAANLSVEIVADGVAAIERLGREPVIDLLLLDLFLPRVSGYQVLEYLRESPLCRATRVLVITAGKPSERDLALSLGVDELLEKPVRIHLLRQALRRLLARSRLGA
jgi:CheY-like chemotaxis protein